MRFIKGATADQRTHAGNAMNYETRQRFDRALPYYGTSGSSSQTAYSPPSAAPAQSSSQASSVDMSAYRPGQAQPRVQSFGQAYGGGSPNFNERTGEYTAPPAPGRVYKGGSPHFDERTGRYTDGRDQNQYFGNQQVAPDSDQSLRVSWGNPSYDQEMAKLYGRDAVLQARAAGDAEVQRAQQQASIRQSIRQNQRFRNPPPTSRPAAPPPAPMTTPPLNDGRKIRRGPVGGYADEPIQMTAPSASPQYPPYAIATPRTEVVSTPPMTFGNPVPQPSFSATYRNFDGSVTDQPNFALRDAFVQNINDAMMPYHMGQKGGPPQFDFQAMLARSRDMVDAGYQNPLAALFG